MNLILFVGLQASGKSTFYRTCFGLTHVLVSKDRLHNNRRPGRRQLQLVEQALASGRSVVVDNTNPTAEDRRPLIDLGRSFGALVAGYYFESAIDDNLRRNQARTGRARVPDVALYATLKRLRTPTSGEGFDQLWRVRLTTDGTFDVARWAGGASDEAI
jgi:predicted kinase